MNEYTKQLEACKTFNSSLAAEISTFKIVDRVFIVTSHGLRSTHIVTNQSECVSVLESLK